ncbi:MAG: hypothetical protein ACRBF0_21565 [Calditrichia bacterium]
MKQKLPTPFGKTNIIAPYRTRGFFNLFRKQTPTIDPPRPGAMYPNELRDEIERIGTGKIVELIRIGYDGELDDMPIIIEITETRREGFSGKIVNVERDLIEENSEKTVYAKRGGGLIHFQYNDGDIKEVLENHDLEELAQERDISAIVEVVSALESGDRVLTAYYDKKHRGTVNVEGVMVSKSPDHKSFRIKVEKINGVELDNQVEKQFNAEDDVVIDISII